MVMKEWECAEHGTFECSDPICPALGCESQKVTRVFLTPPAIGSEARKRFDAGIRKSADMMGINNFRSARAGEQAYGGEAAKEAGLQMLWGDDANKFLGRDVIQAGAAAQGPLTVGDKKVNVPNNGMRSAATEMGITRRSLPKAGEITGHLSEQSMKKVKELT